MAFFLQHLVSPPCSLRRGAVKERKHWINVCVMNHQEVRALSLGTAGLLLHQTPASASLVPPAALKPKLGIQGQRDQVEARVGLRRAAGGHHLSLGPSLPPSWAGGQLGQWGVPQFASPPSQGLRDLICRMGTASLSGVGRSGWQAR